MFSLLMADDNDLTDTVRIDIEKCSLDNKSCTQKKEGKFKVNSNHICYYDRRDENKIYWSDYTIDPQAAFIAAWFFFSICIISSIALLFIYLQTHVEKCLEHVKPIIQRPLSTDTRSEMDKPEQEWEQQPSNTQDEYQIEEILQTNTKTTESGTITIEENISVKDGKRVKRQFITNVNTNGEIKTTIYEQPLE